MCSRSVDTTQPLRDLVNLPNGLAENREGIVSDPAVPTQQVGPDRVARIDFAPFD